jgi:hypothetical protein
MRRRPFDPAWRNIVPLLQPEDVSGGITQVPGVDPFDLFESGEFNAFEASPRPTPMNDLGLVKAR